MIDAARPPLLPASWCSSADCRRGRTRNWGCALSGLADLLVVVLLPFDFVRLLLATVP
jgi:hypothetical protein